MQDRVTEANTSRARAPLVETSSGKIRGTLQNDIYAFKGIPTVPTPVASADFSHPSRAGLAQNRDGAVDFYFHPARVLGSYARW